MKAVLLVGFGEPVSIEEVDPAPVGPRDVRVRIDASGVCDTDLTVAEGGLPRALVVNASPPRSRYPDVHSRW